MYIIKSQNNNNGLDPDELTCLTVISMATLWFLNVLPILFVFHRRDLHSLSLFMLRETCMGLTLHCHLQYMEIGQSKAKPTETILHTHPCRHKMTTGLSNKARVMWGNSRRSERILIDSETAVRQHRLFLLSVPQPINSPRWHCQILEGWV